MAVKRFISWNVNGIRACLGKDFYESFAKLDADIFCLQETKVQPGQVELQLDGYHQYWSGHIQPFAPATAGWLQGAVLPDER